MITSPPHRRSRALAFLMVASLVLGAAACGDDDGDADTTGTTEPAAPSETGAEGAGDVAGEGGGSLADGEKEGESKEGSADTEGEPVEGAAGSGWDQDAREFRGQVGEQMVFDCPPGGSQGRLWGTDIYTDDSSICVAAVHSGLITYEDGGSVVIEITEEKDSFQGSERNGVSSSDYGAWPGSFIFPTS